MEKLLNRKNEKEKLQLLQKRQFFKLRREALKIASSAPNIIQHFCIEFNGDNELLKEFKAKIDNNITLQQYLEQCETILIDKLKELKLDYETIIDSIFNADYTYKKNAVILANHNKYTCLSILYKTINYIDDNLPIITKRKLNKEEKKLIKFLLFKGSAKNYSDIHQVSRDFVNQQITAICNNFNCNSLNTAINLVLIEKYKRQTNNKFLKVINKI